MPESVRKEDAELINEEAREQAPFETVESTDSSPNSKALHKLERHVSNITGELEIERKKNEELVNNMKYLRADIANLQRQADKMLIDVKNQAKSSLALEIISILEDLDRALVASSSSDFISVLEGLKLLRSSIESKLKMEDVARIETAPGSKLDTRLHEVVAFRETSDEEDGSILSVISFGYTMGGKVIKPALVEVARNHNLDVQKVEGDMSAIHSAD
ncbi:MAG: nucleotide exchange factor GrpE [Nitrososphaerales archaeon]